MKKKRRIFIGYLLSKELQDTVEKWKSNFADLPVRWTLISDLHVTLVPPWYEENYEEVISLLRSAAMSLRPFAINFDFITLGSDERSPRLIWAIGETPQELILLKRSLTKILKKEEEKRFPKLHVTLARFNEEQYTQLPKKILPQKILLKDMLTSFSLIESRLDRKEKKYESLATISL